MKTRLVRLLAAGLAFLAANVSAATLYVDLNSTNPVPPYADWSTAATNIQDAVDASTNGDLILVTNGIYQTGGRVIGAVSNRVAVTKAVTVQSVNGPVVTVIQGYQMPGTINGTNAVRCVYLTNNATLIGFTLTNGATAPFFGAAGLPSTFGGGVFCNASSANVSNCVITGNSAGDNGGGTESGTLNNCTIAANSSTWGGGANGSTLINCLVVSNYGGFAGGGVYACTLNDCLIIGNSANNMSGAGGGSFGGTMNNCTLVGNSALTGGGAANGTLNNCIVYYNRGGNYASSYQSVNLNYCCTIPLPSGLGNITNEPAFVNLAGGDYHLQSNSPCINSGNNAYVTTTTDLDGNPRIVGGTVDIGAYEYQTPTSIISYAWLQQYGLPTDGSVDDADLDGTGMNVYQDWIAGLNPTNAQSVLAMLPPAPTTSPAGLIVSWQSVSGIIYFLQGSSNLGMQTAFSTIQSNIVGQAGTTSYTDTNAVGSGPYFYRVGVQ